MAHKKAGGSTQLGRDSRPQYLGTKVGDGEFVHPGMVLIRQRGTKIRPGKNVSKGKDDTLYSMISGKVSFQRKKRRRFDGTMRTMTYVSIKTA